MGGTTFGPRHVPHLVSVYGQAFNIELAPNLAIFRYSDLPGMIGKVGTVLGEHGINIASTAVGREPGHRPVRHAGPGTGRLAVMVVTVDSPVPPEVIEEILGARRLPGRPRGRRSSGRVARVARARAGSLLRLEDRGDADAPRATR